ncbi:glycosyltransferase family 9 protein [Luteipulveratus halotolerans]|uniref:Glycosyl transferase n=1 Tax=Luteipulveratus halotolerans TaxID=1631356 RepID=A0A0L6CLU2_9MICO|nr:glycosyltransferase family 9 protein [Luteipulveratus halotolerans]KNX38704.1 glycosyl transferase [Luteipulveratus halotolerans]
MTRVLAVRLDSVGDVLLTGPAVRALAAHGAHVDLLASPLGAEAARLLPGVRDVLVHDPAWSGPEPAPLDADSVADLVATLRARAYDVAVVFTSYHQSALPAAMIARLAGVPRVAGASEDYAGSLLDVRHRRVPGADDDGGPAGGHEVEAALALAEAAGFTLPADDDRCLSVRAPAHRRTDLRSPYVVVHPGSAASTRGLPPELARGAVLALAAAGYQLVVTGAASERALAAQVAGREAVDLAGTTDLTQLAGVLAGADAVLVGNTGPAHLAAAVGTPVVSLFAPVVPAARWAPWGVPTVLLGDQHAACALTRARTCPVAGHPCLSGVTVGQVVDAVADVSARRQPCAS